MALTRLLCGAVCALVVCAASVTAAGASAGSARPATYTHDASTATAARGAGWRDLGRAGDGLSIPLLIAVTPGVPAGVLEDACHAVSRVDSDAYGQYMSRAELATKLAAHEHAATVTSWLAAAGAATWSVGGTGDFVRATITVKQANALFGAEMHLYQPPPSAAAWARQPQPQPSGVVARSATGHTVPEELRGAVDLVLGLSDFAMPMRTRSVGDAIRSAAATAEAARATRLQLHPSAAAPVAAPAVPKATLVLTVVSSSGLFAAFFPAGNASTYTYELGVSVDGGPWHAVPFALSDTTQASLGFAMFNTTKYVEAYSAYNLTLTTVSVATGAKSLPAFQAMQWDTLPASFRGVLAVPQMSPPAFAAHYGLPPAAAAGDQGQPGTQAVAEFLGGSMDAADLEAYVTMFHLNATGDQPMPTFVGEKYNNPATPGLEAQMDIELIMGVSPAATPSVFWAVAPGGYILDWASAVSDADAPPLVTSLSYGVFEHSPTLPADYYARCNAEFVKMCVRGLTSVFASGDAGASGNGHGGTTCGLNPFFPASSPWVLSVSATTMSPEARPRADGGIGEIPVSIEGGQSWTTGGGFSNLESCRQPEYQAKAVERYLDTAHPLPSVPFNKTGRGYPDVSAIAKNQWMSIFGVSAPIGDGTSAAAPVVAGVIARLNAARLGRGLPPVGFVNPLLYSLAASHPSVFYDVELGGNRCGENVCCKQGFVASRGWDPVSGLGTIGDYRLLEEQVVAAASAATAAAAQAGG